MSQRTLAKMKSTNLVWKGFFCVLVVVFHFVRVEGAVEDVDEEGPKADRCQLPLGMKDKRITDHQIKASSNASLESVAHRGRLGTRKDEYGNGAWSSNNSGSGWLQIDLGDVSMVTKVASQGRQDADQWVKTFYLEYSIDGIHWAECRDVYSARKFFSGNSDRNTIATNTLKPHIYARYVRFVVSSVHGHASMRVEVYGCRNVRSCSIPLGMEDKRIPDIAITASYHSGSHYPKYGRLNFQGNGWYIGSSSDKYLQIDLGQVKTVSRVATQGYVGGSHWTTQYRLQYSIDGMNWVYYYRPNKKKKNFPANNNYYEIHTNTLEKEIIARFIRFWPITYSSSHSLRVELYGCRQERECFVPLGVQDGRITNEEMTASSKSGSHHAYYARINAANNGWIPATQNTKQWLQVDLRNIKKITAVVTQGRYDGYWVTTYKLTHSVDATHWVTNKEYGKEKIYQGNQGYKKLVRQYISPAIYARYVRFLPLTWDGASGIGMRVEIYGCEEEQRCSFPAGMEDGRVDSGAITASSVKNAKCSTNHARINTEGAWCPNSKTNQWLQIYLPRLMMITRIATQGNQNADQWVTSYRLSYSLDGRHWDLQRHQEGKIRVFSGNADRHSIVIHKLFNPFQARYVRFLPKTWHSIAAMRVEVYGCHDTHYCRNPLGLEDGRIRDSELEASSSLDAKHSPTFSRLYAPNNYAWCTALNNTDQWLQIDLRITKTVTKIALQGIGSGWVKRYTLSYGVSDYNWVQYEREGRIKTFLGNYDGESVVSQEVNPSIHARFIRIQPTSWRGRICLRTELYGCLVEGIGE